MRAQAIWTVARGQMQIRAEPLADLPPGGVRLQAICSGVSRGTEALVLAGQVPPELHGVMGCPMQAGAFPFPVKYGYGFVGRVLDGPAERLGQICFALHPHQDVADLPEAAALPLPEGLPPRRAVLAANMETALNILWDSGAGPGDRIAVVGAGVVGLLTATLMAALPGARVTIADTNPARAAIAAALDLNFVAPDDMPRDVDVAVNLSGHHLGLQAALDAAGQEATVVEASWYGDRPATLQLGGRFHPRRLTLKSSQVGDLPPARKPRWSHRRRLQTALALLGQFPALDVLLSHQIPFAEAPDRLPPLLAAGGDALCPLLTYHPSGETDVRA